jgi:hypothetical protein
MHSVHFAGSMTKIPSAALIASFGHSGSQAEQFTQDVAILKAVRPSGKDLFQRLGRTKLPDPIP